MPGELTDIGIGNRIEPGKTGNSIGIRFPTGVEGREVGFVGSGLAVTLGESGPTRGVGRVTPFIVGSSTPVFPGDRFRGGVVGLGTTVTGSSLIFSCFSSTFAFSSSSRFNSRSFRISLNLYRRQFCLKNRRIWSSSRGVALLVLLIAFCSKLQFSPCSASAILSSVRNHSFKYIEV